jgi:hypothetical protein
MKEEKRERRRRKRKDRERERERVILKSVKGKMKKSNQPKSKVAPARQRECALFNAWNELCYL